MITHSGRKRAAIRKTKPVAYEVDAQDYRDLIRSCQASFTFRVEMGGGKLFTTDAAGLWDLYLKNIPAKRRQEHNCHCCRNFIERYGSLVEIDAGGHITPAMWATENNDTIYGAAFSAMFNRVKTAKVTGVFLTKEHVLGTPHSEPCWEHLHVSAPASIMWLRAATTPGQRMAELRQNFITVRTALSEYPAAALDQAVRVFESDALTRSEKFVGPARWLRRLHDRPNGRQGDNVLWREIASAPDGFCHVKSSVIGPLLDDIVAGKPFEAISASFAAMLHPLRYQRPQAAPKAQTLERAEDLVAKLGMARSLERRFARLDEVPRFWEPRAERPPSGAGDVFGRIRARNGAGAVKSVDIPESPITAVRFVEKVLPAAERIEMLVPYHGDFIAMLTAEHADAPVIHKWGNPFSCYVYHRGSHAAQWRLQSVSQAWTKVNAFVRVPNMWGERPMPELGDGYVVVLDGAVDTKTGSGNALFPETLIGELHGARSVIEAYSRTAEIGGRDRGSVCGYSFRKNVRDVRLRVFSSGGWAHYRVDRWE